ncbi:UNVERIFIED_CONTAM: hypothetical protein FKN15_001323 [Acipenser sinensis]
MHEASSRSERDERCDLDNMSSLRCPAALVKRHSYNDRQKETACLQLSLIEMMSSHVHSPSRGVHEDCMGILRVLLEEMDLVSQLNTLNEVWQKMCFQAFKERPDSSAMNGYLWSLTAVVKGVFKGTFQHKTEILENLFTSFDPAFNALYATMFSLSPSGVNQEPSTYTKEGDNVTTNLVSFIDLLEVFVAARTKLRICFPVQRLLFQQAVLALRMVASPVQYLVKKKLLALFKRCLLQKAGEDFFKGEVESSLKHDGNLKSDMLALANGVLQSVHAGWLQDIPVSPKPSFFGGTEVLGNSNVEGGPDLVILRAASLILIKSLEYNVQNSTTEEGVADLLSYLCLLKLFLKKHLKSASLSQHLLHPCAWVSVIFMEQDDDMIEAAKALLILHLHFRRLSGIITGGVDSTGSLTLLTHENGCNPHCMFFLFLSSVAFDHTVLLDFLISTETCFLEYFVKYLKLVREDWEHFCTACHYCDLVSSETGEQNAACSENACGSKTISQDDQACKQLVFPVAENVLESESPESQTKRNVKYSDGPLVDYGSSDESGSDLVEPVCVATGKQCSEGLQDDSFKIGNSVGRSGDKDQTLSKHCQVTGDQGMLMHSSLRDNMLMLQTISDYFWWDRLWFPGNLTWTDFEDRDGLVFAKVSHLFITVPYAVAFMVIRYVFERFIATQIGKKIFGLRETVRLKASENIVLEKYFITCLKNPSQDFKEQIIHHLATLNLLAFSWCCNYIRVGTLVMLIHDASDVLLESAKMFNYAGFTTICNSLFVLFTIVFIITRLVIFPFWIIHCTWFYPVLFFPPFFGYYFFNVMLIVLQMLHIFWTYLILRMVKKFIFGNTGFIQIGDERMLIEPVNNTLSEFSGMEHNVFRQKRSPRSNQQNPKAHQESCKTVAGKKHKKSKSTEDGRGRRNAIPLHNEYTVETLVVADSDMVQYHGAEAAQRFILTVMNMHLMCAGLWCLVEGDTSCKTKLDPPLDGTECGADKWCRAGECVSKTPIPQHVDGDWSSWSQWSVCSRTCGTGARFRQRKCDNPPPGPGGKHCQKASVEHKACEGPPCSKGFPTFRDQQCQSHDRQASKKQNHWTAVINDEKPCALFCNPLGRDSPELVAERVLDGTPCGPYETDLCVNGKCQKIGCDGVIGSSAKEDRCSVCNGDGKSCKIVKGDFSHARGTALKDSSKRSINSDWKIELPGEFQIAGTTVRYVRRGLWEKMSAKGPTETPLQLLVLLFHDQNYEIHYEYTISINQTERNKIEQAKQPEPLYIWSHSSWEDCSVQCGGVLLYLRKGPSVQGGSVYAQSDWSPWQRVSLCDKAASLQAVPPGSLQRESECEHDYITKARMCF